MTMPSGYPAAWSEFPIPDAGLADGGTGMTWKLLGKRFGLFLIVIWGAATLNFFLPRLAPGDPIRERLFALSTQGGLTQTGVEEMVASYNARFGLDLPLWQ